MFVQNNNQRDERTLLLKFLDQKAFQPVQNTFPDRYRERLTYKVGEVQNAVTEIRKRYLETNSAQEIVNQFQSDLHSTSYQELSKDLKQLNLPTFYSVQNDFERLTNHLGIE